MHRSRTTISCRLNARSVAAPIVIALILAVAPARAAARGQAPAAPQPGFPSAILWSVDIGSAPKGPPVIVRDRVVVALDSGVVTARDAADGAEGWSASLAATADLAAGDAVVLVPTEGVVQALDPENGRRRWQVETTKLTAPPLVRGGWVILAAGDQVTALRESDGAWVWARKIEALKAKPGNDGPARSRAAAIEPVAGPSPIALIEQQPTIDGEALFVAITDGRVIALELLTGEPMWQYLAEGKPTAPLVYGDRVYFGSAGRFWCVTRDDGHWDWDASVGLEMIGRAAADERALYIASMDNLLRGYNRRSGSREWLEDLKHRPSAGPLLFGSLVAVPGPVSTFRLFDTRTRRAVGQLTLPDPAVTAPGVSRSGPPRLAVVTNDLGKPWLLSLAGVPPPSVPALTPLSAPPGLALPIPTLPGR